MEPKDITIIYGLGAYDAMEGPITIHPFKNGLKIVQYGQSDEWNWDYITSDVIKHQLLTNPEFAKSLENFNKKSQTYMIKPEDENS